MTVKRVQFIRQNPQEAADFTGLEGELIVERDSWMLRIHDGMTPGGFMTLTNETAQATFLTQAQFDEEIKTLQDTLTEEINNNFTDLAGEILVAIGPVKSIIAAPPGSPAPGDRYLVAHSGLSGVFAGQNDQVAQWNGTLWEFSGKPLVGAEIYVQDQDRKYYYDGTTWILQNPDLTLQQNFADVYTALDTKAPLFSPTFIGVPTAPTPPLDDSTTKIATTAFVQTAITNNFGDISSAFGNRLTADGWQKFPGGFIIQWAHGEVDVPSELEGAQTIPFPMVFPTACLMAVVCMQIATGTVAADFWYQIIGTPTQASVNVYRQRPSAGGLEVNTQPLIIAVGY